ncbi:TonB-dependent receptor domain-containing protein [Gracilimonas sp.]|uniref:TonB-dependent receptor domain-containing protein n=1 Tax=Gracilimonas sp. TaxID=1974203 RepID=UPI00287145F1|nr:TonB-dependent receptor [Gracilimonas sp.]
MKYPITIITTVLLAVTQLVHAQVADTLDLGEIVITASKTPTTERETTKPVTVISRAEIEQQPSASVAELLNQQNGLMINGAVSSPGKDKSVYLRGASTQYTLILIDGYPVTDPSSEGGAFDLRLMSLENVERIEIVKGSMSTLYGSDAISGVINIITKKPEAGAFNLYAKAAYGSFNTNELSLGANGNAGIASYKVNVSRDFTEGISEAESTDGPEFGKDGYERIYTSAEIGIEPLRNFNITPFVNYSTYDGDYDDGAFADANNSYEASLLNTGARFQFTSGHFNIKEAVTFTQTERKFTDQYGVFNPKASLLNSDLHATYNRFNSVRFLAGFSYQNLGFELDGIDESTSLVSPYLTVYLKSNVGLNAELGLRVNNHSEYGSNWTFNVAPVFNVNEEIKLLASVSSGFKAPTLNELFGPFGSNISLEPQKSLTFDGGIEYRHSASGFKGSVIYFKRQIEDLISYDSNLGYININEQDDYGVEVQAEYNWAGSRAEVFYNFLEGAITQNGEETDNLIRRPDHAFGVNLFRQLTSNWSLKLHGKYVGERKDLYFNMNTFTNESVTLDSYVLINIGSAYTLLNGSLTLFTDIENLLDADYTEVYGFNTPGIHFKGGIRLNY